MKIEHKVIEYLDGEVILWPEFIEEESGLIYFNQLMAINGLEQGSIRIFGKTHPKPRLEAFFNESELDYAYSNQILESKKFTELLKDLKTRVETVTQAHFNCVLLNLYRNGQDSNGWHADNESSLGTKPVIASLSFGASRNFMLKNIETGVIQKIQLNHGDLLLMNSGVQEKYKHCIPKQPKITEARVNLTFRRLIN